MFRNTIEKLLAVLALLVLSPVLIIVAAAVLIDGGRPVLFRQIRIGRNGATFHILKFRSMRTKTSGMCITAAGDRRITAVGHYLRKYKIDEIPQLWNVVRGEMQLIGPRPEVPAFVDTKNVCWQAVLSVLPGITDPITLMFRNEEELLAHARDPEAYYRETLLPMKLHLSATYYRNRIFRRDCVALALTILYSIAPSRWNQENLNKYFDLGVKHL